MARGKRQAAAAAPTPSAKRTRRGVAANPVISGPPAPRPARGNKRGQKQPPNVVLVTPATLQQPSDRAVDNGAAGQLPRPHPAESTIVTHNAPPLRQEERNDQGGAHGVGLNTQESGDHRRAMQGMVNDTEDGNGLPSATASDAASNAFANVLIETLRTVREAAMSESSSRLGSRPSFLKELPKFTGDPLEWVHFERRYRASTRDFGYSDSDNVTRLQKALDGEARERNKALLATARSPQLIMDSLQLQFGHRQSIADRISDEITDLPSMREGEANIVQFATGLNNALTAFKSLELNEYLKDTSLWKAAISKLPGELQWSFSDQWSPESDGGSRLESLAAFMMKKAANAVNSGIIDLSATSYKRQEKGSAVKEKDATRRHAKPSKAAVVCVNAGGPEEVTKHSNKQHNSNKCSHCKANHKLKECRDFSRESTDGRWEIVKKLRVCFNCLGGGHSRFECKSPRNCSKCHRSHHTLLHDEQRDKGNNRRHDSNKRDDRSRDNRRRDDRRREDRMHDDTSRDSRARSVIDQQRNEKEHLPTTTP